MNDRFAFEDKFEGKLEVAEPPQVAVVENETLKLKAEVARQRALRRLEESPLTKALELK